MNSGTKPLFTLTIEEFTELTKGLVNEILKSREKSGEKQINEKEEHYNIKELADFLKCSKVSIHKYKKKGLPFYRIGRKILFKKTEVLNFMRGLKNRKVIVS